MLGIDNPDSTESVNVANCHTVCFSDFVNMALDAGLGIGTCFPQDSIYS